MPAENNKEIPMAGGKVSSSAIPGYYLIPTEATRRLAIRFDVGVERKGKLAWNAATPNQEVLVSEDFILHRIGHVIAHANKLRDLIINKQPLLADGVDDDAGAIAWSGAFLCCATRALQDAMDTVSIGCSACGGDGKQYTCCGAGMRSHGQSHNDQCNGSMEECGACHGSGKQAKKTT